MSCLDYHEIIPNLYLGSIFVAEDEDTLKDIGITHIVTAGRDMQPMYPKKFNYRVLKLRDYEDENITKYFDSSIEFIENALNSDGKVLVHCLAGVSRSSAIVWAYLIKTKQWEFEKALEYVQSKRRVANPNEGYQLQLVDFASQTNNINY